VHFFTTNVHTAIHGIVFPNGQPISWKH